MRKLIIVCEKELRHYGDFLSQLISLVDDKEGQIIGAKDGSVAAQVWTEKEYSANAVQISSEQYILFIGNSKVIKEKRSHMQKKFSEHGMQYGWLGKQGFLFVEKVVSLDEYDNFFEFAKKIQPEILKLIEKKSDVVALPDPSGEVEKENKGVKKLLTPIKTIPAVLLNAPKRGLDLFAKVNERKKIEEQEYSCLVLLFYLKGLVEFLRLCED